VPAISESDAAPATVLPQVVAGGGFVSQLVAFDRLTGVSNAGTFIFTDQAGLPMFVVDVTAPTVSITSPANGATVTGTIDVTADASDDVGVAGVQFMLDGSPLGAEDTSAPYSTSWDPSGLSGPHFLTASARDAAGNRTTSSVVMVTVNAGKIMRRSQITSQ